MSGDILELAKMREMVRDGRARDLRVGARLTLREVAVEIGVNPATVHYWEHGRRPRGEAAWRYAKLLASLERLVAR